MKKYDCKFQFLAYAVWNERPEEEGRALEQDGDDGQHLAHYIRYPAYCGFYKAE